MRSLMGEILLEITRGVRNVSPKPPVFGGLREASKGTGGRAGVMHGKAGVHSILDVKGFF